MKGDIFELSRPLKWRKVEFIPDIQHFIPVGVELAGIKENILKIEEIESIRLKDIEGLEQEQCAKKMEISQPTFPRFHKHPDPLNLQH